MARLTGVGVEPDKRDEVVNFVNEWGGKAQLPVPGKTNAIKLIRL